MSLSDRLSFASGVLWLVSAFVGVLAGAITIWGLRQARKDAKASADALKQFQVASQVAISDANQRAAEATLHALQIQRAIDPRRLLPNEETRLIDAVKPFPRKGVVYVTSYNPMDGEAHEFGTALIWVLDRAGFTVGNKTGVPYELTHHEDLMHPSNLPNTKFGIRCFVHPYDFPQASTFASWLNDFGSELAKAGFKLDPLWTNPFCPRGAVVIEVGEKPKFPEQ